LITSRSDLVMPGRPCADLVARGDVDHVEREVGELGAEGRARLSPPTR
jgi:hypothetical protein